MIKLYGVNVEVNTNNWDLKYCNYGKIIIKKQQIVKFSCIESIEILRILFYSVQINSKTQIW